jgi:uncharacterized protein (TIGR02246 family)
MQATKKSHAHADRAELVRRLFDTYVSGDRAEAEQLIARDFTFTSPYDDHIDRATYFKRCFEPQAGKFAPFAFHEIMIDGNDVYVTYTGGTADHRFHNTEKFELIGDQVATVEVFFGLPPSGKVDVPAEQAIRKLLDDRAAALRAKDAAKLTAVYAKDATSFGLAPPLVAAGKDLLDPKSLAGWFATWKAGIDTSLRDLKIVADDHVAFATALENMSGDKKEGPRTDFWYRASFAFVRQDGAWKIANVHQSVPFSMDGDNKALVDLKP